MADYVMEKGVLDTSGCQVIEYSTVPHIEGSFMADVRDAFFEKRPPVLDGIFELYKKHCDTLLTDEAFVGALRDLDLDLFVIDNIVTIRMLTIIPYRLGVPFAFPGTHYDPVAQRIPFSPPVTPWALLPFTHRMTFPQRLQTTLLYLTSFFADPCSYSDAVSRYAPEMPDIPVDTLVARAEIWLVDTDHILDYPRPAVPNVKLIGGTAPEPPKPLPAEFQSFMDGATEGVVVVSFGSYVLDLPREISDKIFSALRKLPFRAVFRSRLTSPEPGTVMTSPWLPQNDLLGHANTRVLVSHCGKNGQYEALYHAVPVVCLPIFTDQPYNAERMRVKGMAERLDLNTVSEEELGATILKVGTEKRYKRAISAASELFRVEFGVPVNRASFWLDHVMKYGAAHMRSAGQDLAYYRFIGLDILAAFFLVVSASFVLTVPVVWLLCRCVFCRRSKHETD